ncbi:MAG: HAD-IIA family hydrolase [Proteobacteria bacterium]|nr:HAD-IIA family hydrolase [Pseudomonadota bacterium]
MMTTDGTLKRDHKGTIVFDLDGVVYVGSAGVPGAADAMRSLERSGWHLVFATNNSTRAPVAVADHIEDRTGFRSHGATIVTSAMAAATWVASGNTSAFVVGEDALRGALIDAGIDVVTHGTPDAVVVGLDRDINYETIAVASSMVRNGSTFVATNTDATFPTMEGPVPGAGSIIAAIATASGREPIACGKPLAPMIDLIRQRIRGETVWVVGDRPETDIAMAAKVGWKSILVHTGITESNDVVPDSFAPDHRAASITDVPRLVTEVS